MVFITNYFILSMNFIYYLYTLTLDIPKLKIFVCKLFYLSHVYTSLYKYIQTQIYLYCYVLVFIQVLHNRVKVTCAVMIHFHLFIIGFGFPFSPSCVDTDGFRQKLLGSSSVFLPSDFVVRKRFHFPAATKILSIAHVRSCLSTAITILASYCTKLFCVARSP